MDSAPRESVFGRFVLYVELAALACLFFAGRAAYRVWRPPPAPVEAPVAGLSAPGKFTPGKEKPRSALTLPPTHDVERDARIRTSWGTVIDRAQPQNVEVLKPTPIAPGSPALARGNGAQVEEEPVDWRPVIRWLLGAFVLAFFLLARSLRAAIAGGKRQPLSHD